MADSGVLMIKLALHAVGCYEMGGLPEEGEGWCEVVSATPWNPYGT